MVWLMFHTLEWFIENMFSKFFFSFFFFSFLWRIILVSWVSPLIFSINKISWYLNLNWIEDREFPFYGLIPFTWACNFLMVKLQATCRCRYLTWIHLCVKMGFLEWNAWNYFFLFRFIITSVLVLYCIYK